MIGPVPPDTQLELGVGLPFRSQTALTARVQEITNPESPKYQQFVTDAEYESQFAPTTADYQALRSWAQSNGLVVPFEFSHRALLTVRGTAAAVEKALYLNLQYRLRPDGTRFYAPDREPSLDAVPTVLFISNLDNYVPVRPLVADHRTGTWRCVRLRCRRWRPAHLRGGRRRRGEVLGVQLAGSARHGDDQHRTGPFSGGRRVSLAGRLAALAGWPRQTRPESPQYGHDRFTRPV